MNQPPSCHNDDPLGVSITQADDRLQSQQGVPEPSNLVRSHIKVIGR
jgi:hypothetical protein